MKSYILRLKGGAGSGHHGHKGIPGHRGGSLPADGSASASQSSIPASPKTAEAWAERLASKRSMWKLSDEDFATEVNDLLVEKFPELENDHDKLSDLVYSAVSQRVENMEEVDLQSTKLNRREVHDPNDKPGDLSGLRILIPNKDGELSHGSKVELPVRASDRSPVFGAQLYRMPNEDRPSWGVHGGSVFLTNKGSKIVNFIKDNKAEFIAFAKKKFGVNGGYTVETAVEYASGTWDDGSTLGTMASHEASGNFGDIADLYTAYAESQKKR